jgi:hypothetical protein
MTAGCLRGGKQAETGVVKLVPRLPDLRPAIPTLADHADLAEAGAIAPDLSEERHRH